MNALPASVGAPALPQVSLIPPEFARRSRQTQLRAVSLIIVVAALGLTMSWWFFAVGLKTVAESALADEQSKRDELTAKLATYSYILDARDAHRRAVEAEAWVTSTDVRWDAYVAQMEQALPTGVTIAKIEVLQVSPAGPQRSGGSGPFDQPDLGTISLTGIATDPQLSNDYIAALARISGLYHVEIFEIRIETSPEAVQPLWEFILTMDISVDALSGRSILADGSAQ